jgi:hypothetical protein
MQNYLTVALETKRLYENHIAQRDLQFHKIYCFLFRDMLMVLNLYWLFRHQYNFEYPALYKQMRTRETCRRRA